MDKDNEEIMHTPTVCRIVQHKTSMHQVSALLKVPLPKLGGCSTRD